MSPKTRAKSPALRKSPPAKEVRPSARLEAIRAAAERLPKAAPSRTYFLLVSTSEPSGRRFVQLRAPSVLAWFQRVWSTGSEHWRSELHGHVYGLSKLVDMIDELKLPRPSSDAELAPLLDEHIYYERNLVAEPHFVHVQTDDDEVDVDYFFFDDAFLRTAEAGDRLPSPDVGRSALLGGEDHDDAYAALIRHLGE